MFLKVIQLDNDSYIEMSDRITAEGKKLQISMRGVRDNKSVTVMSTILEHADVMLLSQIIQDWVTLANEGQ